jgi:phosphate transport system substrate-binding protein
MMFLLIFFNGENLLFSLGDREPVYPVVRVSQSLSLWEYEPFNFNNKLARLRGNSSLRLTENLPRLDGATALYPVYASFVQAVYPREDFLRSRTDWRIDSLLLCTQTPGAYRNLINGGIDIIFCMEPSNDQIREAADKGLIFNMTPIGKDAFVFFINKNNPVNNITSEQIRMIYSGEITNWKEIGGDDEDIIPYQRPQNSGSQTLLESIMGEIPIMEPLMENVVPSMGQIFERVSEYLNYPNAIGYSFLFFSTEMVRNNEIKLLSIDGIMPSRETIITGEYIFSNTFYAITVGNEIENTKKLIEWILSEEGQYLIEQTGYIPINLRQ